MSLNSGSNGPLVAKRGLKVSDSFGYLQRLLQGLFISRIRRSYTEVLYRLRR